MARETTAVEDMTVHLVEDRRARISPWGLGNSKLGARVYTYSLPAGRDFSCPGSTTVCEAVCYAKRMATSENGLLRAFSRNFMRRAGLTAEELPADAEIVRIHVSGDFDSPGYVGQWISLARSRPEVRFFGYTRSWTLGDEMLQPLEQLRSEPNVQLFASVDAEHTDEQVREIHGRGWRVAWLANDRRVYQHGEGQGVLDDNLTMWHDRVNPAGTMALVCPEERGRKDSCEACRYCIDGRRNDVIFSVH